jgi:RimJ/RimL family protein N-acetyltransferase
LATGAAQACIALARRDGHARVVAPIVPGNEASERVARRLGMRAAGEVESHGESHRRWVLDL